MPVAKSEPSKVAATVKRRLRNVFALQLLLHICRPVLACVWALAKMWQVPDAGHSSPVSVASDSQNRGRTGPQRPPRLPESQSQLPWEQHASVLHWVGGAVHTLQQFENVFTGTEPRAASSQSLLKGKKLGRGGIRSRDLEISKSEFPGISYNHRGALQALRLGARLAVPPAASFPLLGTPVICSGLVLLVGASGRTFVVPAVALGEEAAQLTSREGGQGLLIWRRISLHVGARFQGSTVVKVCAFIWGGKVMPTKASTCVMKKISLLNNYI